LKTIFISRIAANTSTPLLHSKKAKTISPDCPEWQEVRQPEAVFPRLFSAPEIRAILAALSDII